MSKSLKEQMPKSTLQIASGLSLPLNAATQTFAFIARKGAGKTYTAGKLVELLLEAGVQVVVLDTVGNWYGLRLGVDGKASAFDVPVLGGLRGDIPLEATSGALIADIVVDTGRSMVLDASQFSKADRQRFAAAFGERLWLRKKGEREPSPVHLVIEESQLIVPQDVRGDTAHMVGVYEEIIRLGRNYGIGVSMITQRPQSVNKEVLNQTECLFVGQINGAQERDALKKWITHQGMDTHLVDELPTLKVGTFYVWSPQWLELLEKVQILPKRTLDASATPTVGGKRVQRDLKPLDLTALQSQMAETIERAKADDPKELRKQIAEMDRKIRSLEGKTFPAAAPGPAKPVEVLTDVDRTLLTTISTQLTALSERLIAPREFPAHRLVVAVNDALNAYNEEARRAEASDRAEFLKLIDGKRFERIRQKVDRVPAVQVTACPPPRNQATRAALGQVAQAAAAQMMRRATGSGESMPPGEKAVLTAAAQWTDGVTRDQLGVLTGYKRSSRDAYIARLAARGWVASPNGHVVATEAGLTALGADFEPLPTGDALYQWWQPRLPEGERKVLDILVAAGGRPVTRDAIDEATGYKRSSRDAYLSRLAARKLVESVGRGEVRASAELFS